MKKKPLPLSYVYRLLEPGPVVLLTTAGVKRPNIMTMSWHMMIDFEPPLIGCVVSNRDYTFDILRKTKECVSNIPTVERWLGRSQGAATRQGGTLTSSENSA